jgi:hypothetical protein
MNPQRTPRVCPPPPDCPLYQQRVQYAHDEPLRRAVLIERRGSADLSALIRSEAARPTPALPTAPPTRPVVPTPEPDLLTAHPIEKGATHA